MQQISYGDGVKVLPEAPEQYRPGAVGSVISIVESLTKAFEEKTGVPQGEIAVGVEFSDGTAIELPLRWLVRVGA
ncbi:MAG: hypothetical protein JKP96_15950 [Oceanicaulis sp.]|jgi:hypothetical protein|nr:hypothetical protein [Oceanicaulis sp.]